MLFDLACGGLHPTSLRHGAEGANGSFGPLGGAISEGSRYVGCIQEYPKIRMSLTQTDATPALTSASQALRSRLRVAKQAWNSLNTSP